MRKTIVLIITILCIAMPYVVFADTLRTSNIQINVAPATDPKHLESLGAETFGDCIIYIDENGITRAEETIITKPFAMYFEYNKLENKAYLGFENKKYGFCPGDTTISVQKCENDDWLEDGTMQFSTPMATENGKFMFPLREVIEKICKSKVDYHQEGINHIIDILFKYKD